ncbi:hypothetical protein ACFQDN_21865 [Pseudomonas asuensis]
MTSILMKVLTGQASDADYDECLRLSDVLDAQVSMAHEEHGVLSLEATRHIQSRSPVSINNDGDNLIMDDGSYFIAESDSHAGFLYKKLGHDDVIRCIGGYLEFESKRWVTRLFSFDDAPLIIYPDGLGDRKYETQEIALLKLWKDRHYANNLIVLGSHPPSQSF